MSREAPLTPEQKKLLDHLSRETDPGAEALAQLAFELQTSELARKAFAAELVRLRQFRALASSNRRALPQKLREALDAAPRAKSFDHLVALADANGAPQPELDITG